VRGRGGVRWHHWDNGAKVIASGGSIEEHWEKSGYWVLLAGDRAIVGSMDVVGVMLQENSQMSCTRMSIFPDGD